MRSSVFPMVRMVILGMYLVSAGIVSAVSLPKKPVKHGDDARRGEALFNETCRQCHPTKTGTDGIGPSLKGLSRSATLPASGRPVTDENIKRQIREGGAEMPGFASKYTARDLNALVAFLRTL